MAEEDRGAQPKRNLELYPQMTVAFGSTLPETLPLPCAGKVPSQIAVPFLREEVSHLASPCALLTPLAEHKMHIKGINGMGALVKGPSTHQALGERRKEESTCTQVGAGGG